MKVLHLVAGGLNGGAARGALWLHQALLEQGVQSSLLNDMPGSTDYPGVIAPPDTVQEKLGRILRGRLDSGLSSLYRHRVRTIFSTGWPGVDFRKHDAYKLADIVHLHWINAGFVNLKHLARVDKPIVWTMRDMWPMTGGCHLAMDCQRYVSGCGKCPQLGSNSLYDLSWLVMWRKTKYLPKSLQLVGISHWLTECAQKSHVFKGFKLATIPNCLDINEFSPINKDTARDILGLPRDKPIVLAGAQYPDLSWKGFNELLAALEICESKFELLFFGKIKSSNFKDLSKPWRSVGFVNDSLALRILYSAADVFVAPSLMEAFGKTLAESLACGTPVVAFDATGPRDIVTHQVDGYLAEPFSPKALADGIQWVLDHDDPQRLSKAAREKVLSKFDCRVVAQQYKVLYEQVLATR